ncbi:hypothetical protein EDB83DRAFT_2524191 [Lactarius deliciosus]|nr:hypothetical protein EDB83DRAFT_2524191 [Lactarius deliciosus]
MGKDTMPTLSRPDPSRYGPQSQLGTAKVEAHVGVPACGDAHPPLIPSPDPGVTPLTKCLDAQSDVRGVARVRSPRMLQLLRRVREVTSTTAEASQTKEACPSTPLGQTTIPAKGDACPPFSVRNAGIAPHGDDDGSDDEETPPSHRTVTIGMGICDCDDTAKHGKLNKHMTRLLISDPRALSGSYGHADNGLL